jgi:hypothetical protein
VGSLAISRGALTPKNKNEQFQLYFHDKILLSIFILMLPIVHQLYIVGLVCVVIRNCKGF